MIVKEMPYSDKIQWIERRFLLLSYSSADMPEIDSSIWISNVDTIQTNIELEISIILLLHRIWNLASNDHFVV